MSGNDSLATANAATAKKDSANKAGGTSQSCNKATVVVTVVRRGGAKGDNFWNDIRLEGPGGRFGGRKVCDKPQEFGGLEPGTYEASAKPDAGSGHAFAKPVQVTVASGDKQQVQVEVVPYEVVEIRPHTGKSQRQYVNLEPKDDDASWGKEFEVSAHVAPKQAGVDVHWDLELGKDNGKYGDKVINGPNHRFKITQRSKTDEKGVARATLTLGCFGGSTVRALAAISEDVTHPSAGAKKSDEFVVWRKHWYQISHPETSAPPSRAGLMASFDKVFLATEEVDEKAFKKADFSDHYRPAWQFDPGSGNDDKLCVGTHNIDEFAALYEQPTGGRNPKSHIILCDWQWDGDDRGSAYVTEHCHAEFRDGDNPAERKVEAKLSGHDDYMVGVFDPPLKAGTKVIVSGTWQQKTWNAAAGAWQLSHQGTLQDGEYRLDAGRAASNEVLVKRPAGKCDPGCPCGGPPQAPTVDQFNTLDVWVRFSAAHGTYLGWAEDPYHTVVILGMNTDDLNDTVNHEIGHLFGQTPPTADAQAGIPPHPKMYQQRGGSGTHCAEGATWTPDPNESPQLDPDVPGERDAQGNASGEYSDGTCIMFGIGNAGKREFCEHCAAQLEARDLSEFAD